MAINKSFRMIVPSVSAASLSISAINLTEKPAASKPISNPPQPEKRDMVFNLFFTLR